MRPPFRPFTLNHYQYILRSALDSGYGFLDFAAVEDLDPDSADHICFLRHDCDNDLVAAAEIARLEESLSVRSTYFLMVRSALYNLFSLPNVALVREIVHRGHWIGLHFDEQRYTHVAPFDISQYVDREREWLASEFGVPIDVVSFHQPSTHVLQGGLSLHCVNTYDLDPALNIHYISDSNTVWQEGCPSGVFRARKYQRLQLLLHPEWWTPQPMTVEEKWNEMFRHNFALMQQSLLARERAYLSEREITFRWRTQPPGVEDDTG